MNGEESERTLNSEIDWSSVVADARIKVCANATFHTTAWRVCARRNLFILNERDRQRGHSVRAARPIISPIYNFVSNPFQPTVSTSTWPRCISWYSLACKQKCKIYFEKISVRSEDGHIQFKAKLNIPIHTLKKILCVTKRSCRRNASDHRSLPFHEHN